MAHWTSHAFHASVASPPLIYGDVTLGFSDGYITFAGRPFRSWRTWQWAGVLARLLVLVTAAAFLAPAIFEIDRVNGVTGDLALEVAAVTAISILAMWAVGAARRRIARGARGRVAERAIKLPISDVSAARLSGKTLTVRAPFDQSNRSDRWTLRLDSHEQGESLMALLGRS